MPAPRLRSLLAGALLAGWPLFVFAAQPDDRRRAAAAPAQPAGPTEETLEAMRQRIPAGEAAAVDAEARRLLAEAERSGAAESRLTADLLNILSLALVAEGKATDPEALAVTARNLALTERLVGSEDLLYARALTDHGWTAFQAGDFATARPYLERSLALRKRLLGADDASVGRAMMNLGGVILRSGDPVGARPLMEGGLTIIEKADGPDTERVALGNMNLGILLIDLRALDEAAVRLEKARATLTRIHGEKNFLVARALNNLGIIAEQSGDLVAARDLYMRVLAIQEEVLPPGHLQMAAILHNLAVVNHKLGDTRTAVEQSRRALAIGTEALGAENQDTLRTAESLGVYLSALGETEEAERLLETALAGREKTLGPDHFDTAESLASLGDLYVDTGRAEEALPLLERALAVREKAVGPDHPFVALSLTSLARCEARLGRSAPARAHFERALAIREARFGANHPELARSLDELASFLFDDGHRSEALPYARRAAVMLTRQARDTIAVLPERQALLLVASQPHPEEILFSGLLAAGADREPWLAACWEWTLARRGAVLEELAARNRRGLTSETAEAREAWKKLAAARTRLAALWAGGDDGDPEAHRAALEAARRDREAAEDLLARTSAPYRDARADAQATLAEVRDALPKKSALVEWVRVRAGGSTVEGRVQRDIALILGSGELTRFVDLGPSAEIDASVEAWRATLTATFTGLDPAPASPGAGAAPAADPMTSLRQAGDRLRTRAFDPVRAVTGGAKRLFLVPEGAIHSVDFAALPERDGRYLIESGPAIQLLSTGRDLARLARRRDAADAGGRGILAIGAPDFTATAEARRAAMPADGPVPVGGGMPAFRGAPPRCLDPTRAVWAPLPESGSEALRIADLFRGREPALALTGAAASEDRFKQEAHGRRVLHLATHGYFLAERCDDDGAGGSRDGRGAGGRLDPATIENPLLLSGLVLAGANRTDRVSSGGDDGILTAEEMAALDLRGVDLVSLSACDTGRGTVAAGEGIFGLRRAMEIAGVRAGLMSLWPVPDRESGRFMTRFYRERLAGVPAPDAARGAARAALDDLRRRELPEHPYLWAGFVTTGDWR